MAEPTPPAAEFDFEWETVDNAFESAGLDEWEMIDGYEFYPSDIGFEVTTPQTPTSAAIPSVNLSSTPCPVHSTGRTTARCKTPQLCPPIPDLLCVTSINNIPFEYVAGKGMIRRNRTTGLYQVVSRQANRKQKFIPAVGQALSIFLAMMTRFGMPVEAIFTAGSLYCRCITNTNTLSNHSFGDAIDVVGVRWRSPSGSRETIVHNYQDPAERAILRRINACLRLSFSTVIDYHRSDHRDHFHCDMNRGRGRVLSGRSTVAFVQEALNLIGGHQMQGGKLDNATKQALSAFSGRGVQELADNTTYSSVLD
ncbi:MAG: extensin family protein, partial [Methylococcales bacterium]